MRKHLSKGTLVTLIFVSLFGMEKKDEGHSQVEKVKKVVKKIENNIKSLVEKTCSDLSRRMLIDDSSANDIYFNAVVKVEQNSKSSEIKKKIHKALNDKKNFKNGFFSVKMKDNVSALVWQFKVEVKNEGAKIFQIFKELIQISKEEAKKKRSSRKIKPKVYPRWRDKKNFRLKRVKSSEDVKNQRPFVPEEKRDLSFDVYDKIRFNLQSFINDTKKRVEKKCFGLSNKMDLDEKIVRDIYESVVRRVGLLGKSSNIEIKINKMLNARSNKMNRLLSLFDKFKIEYEAEMAKVFKPFFYRLEQKRIAREEEKFARSNATSESDCIATYFYNVW